jgi:hypothetical protein
MYGEYLVLHPTSKVAKRLTLGAIFIDIKTIKQFLRNTQYVAVNMCAKGVFSHRLTKKREGLGNNNNEKLVERSSLCTLNILMLNLLCSCILYNVQLSFVIVM